MTIKARTWRWAGLRAVLACGAVALVAGDAAAKPPAVPSFTPNHLFVGGHDIPGNVAALFEFDEAGAFVRKIQMPATTAGDEIYSIAFAPDGSLYCSVLGGVVLRVSAALGVTTFLDTSDGLRFTTGAAFGPQGLLYVANRFGGGKVLAVDSGRNVVASYTAPADASPSYVSFGPEGHAYIASHGNSPLNEIQELDSNLRFVRAFGGAAFTNYPAHLVFGRNDVMYAADYGAPAVRRFDADGAPLADLPATGLLGPYGDVFGPDGNLYVANYEGHEVLVLDPETGATIRTLSHPDLTEAAGVAFAPFRFRTKLKGTLVGVGQSAAALGEPDAVVSISPGSGRVMISLTDSPSSTDVMSVFPGTEALVFHGNDMVSSNRRTLGMHGTSVSRRTVTRSVGSVDLVVKGRKGRAGFFVPKSLAATMHLARPGAGLIGSFSAAKLVP